MMRNVTTDGVIKAPFKVLKIDTGANKSSIIGFPQYEAYCVNFGLFKAIRPTTQRIKVIGGKQEAVGEVVIQIPFQGLSVIIDVRFIILSSDVPTLLSLKYLWSNRIDISIQECVKKLGFQRQDLEMIDFFLVYK